MGVEIEEASFRQAEFGPGLKEGEQGCTCNPRCLTCAV